MEYLEHAGCLLLDKSENVSNLQECIAHVTECYRLFLHRQQNLCL